MQLFYVKLDNGTRLIVRASSIEDACYIVRAGRKQFEFEEVTKLHENPTAGDILLEWYK